MKGRVVPLLALLAFSVLAAPAQDRVPHKRPLGVPADALWFGGKWYRVHLEKLTWRSARDKCARLGGQLAVVRDQRTQDFIKELADDLTLWLGATDEKVEGLWMWVDGSQMGFKAWDAGQPDNAHGGQHYLGIFPGGVWNDDRNNGGMVGFICEWKAR